MQFSFVDRVLEVQSRQRITTLKCLSQAEEYLADHFPRFPVMPGVLMLEAMTEAGAWLVRVSEDFAHTIITLQEARNIKFEDFVRPGRVLEVKAEIMDWTGNRVKLKTQGTVEGRVAVSGRISLVMTNLADERRELAGTDDALRDHWRAQWPLIFRPTSDAANGSSNQALSTAAVQKT